MNPLREIIEKLKAFDPEAVAIEAVEENVAFIEDANAQQLLEGEQPNGSKIEPQYKSEEYADLKESLYPNPKRDKFTPNLKLSGDFHEAIRAKPTKEEIIFENTDPKAPKLLRDYGDVLGLSEKHKEELKNDYILPALIEARNLAIKRK